MRLVPGADANVPDCAHNQQDRYATTSSQISHIARILRQVPLWTRSEAYLDCGPAVHPGGH
jgi:hypothetical protein